MSCLVELKNALKPNALTDQGTEGGPRFILSKEEWLKIQVYVNNAQILPITDNEFRNSLGARSSFDLTDFEALINAYTLIYQHTGVWRDETFPRSVDLASQVYQYGTQKVPVYYPAISKLADELTALPGDKDLQQKMKATLESLRSTAQGYADEAEAVSLAVKTFADETQADKMTLVGRANEEGLRKYYNDTYGKMSKEVERLNKEIEAVQKVLEAINDEYDHDVIVAGTSATYVWVFPVGTIAAAVVAGVYGDKAVKALARARAAEKKIKKLNEKLAQNARLMIYLNNASLGIVSINNSLSDALPAIQKIQGVWAAMSSDLGQIVEIIDRDISEAIDVIKSLGVDEAMRAWQMVAAAANAYRLNAYVQEPAGVDGSSELHRLNTLILCNVA